MYVTTTVVETSMDEFWMSLQDHSRFRQNGRWSLSSGVSSHFFGNNFSVRFQMANSLLPR
jgi:hypothetical protein